MKIHLGVKAFKCNDCGMVHKYYLIYSQSLITIFLIVIITQCISQEFATKSALKSHINSFHTPDELKEMATCPVCKKVKTNELC